MIKDEDILSIEELIDKYGEELKKAEYNIEIIENMSATILDHYKVILENYEDKIKDIYTAIAAVKKMDVPTGDTYSIKKLIENIIYLRNDLNFIYTKDLKENLCYKVYNQLTKDEVYSKYYDNEMEEDYKPEHLFDIEYHLNNFRKYCKNDKFIKVLDNILNNEIWRYI